MRVWLFCSGCLVFFGEGVGELGVKRRDGVFGAAAVYLRNLTTRPS